MRQPKRPVGEKSSAFCACFLLPTSFGEVSACDAWERVVFPIFEVALVAPVVDEIDVDPRVVHAPAVEELFRAV